MQVNEIYEINGVEKDFLSWCRLFNKRELLFKIDDEIRPLQHWCRIYCINFATVLHRLERGWSIN